MDDDVVYTTEYDVMVVGTGIVESIVAASLARAGQKVLHVDSNEYYGSDFASLPLHQFEEWMTTPVDDEASRSQPYSLSNAFRCTLLHHDKDDSFNPRSSSFSLDIQPKMLLSNSPLVDVLVHSGVGRYLDFMAMQGTFMYSAQPQNKNPPIWEVPCSKTDVFKSKLNVLEKRHLMKFLQFVADYGEADVTTLNERDLTSSRALKRPQNKQQEVATASFDQFDSFQVVLAKHFKLSTALQQVVLYAVLLETSTSPTAPLSTPDSLDAIYNFVTSIGRFAPSPYLTPMYGISEVAQSFCRLSAVYNGTYILRTPVSHLNVVAHGGDVATCAGVSTAEGRTFRAKHVVLNATAHGHSIGYVPSAALLRGIFVVDASVQQGVDRLVVVIPPGEVTHANQALSTSAVHVLQMDSTMGVCASGYFLIHVTTVVPLATPADDLVSYMKAIVACLGQVKPVWSSIFTIPVVAKDAAGGGADLANVFVCPSPPMLDTTLASCVDAARAVFRAICPDESVLFLPKSASEEAMQAQAQDDDPDVALLDQAAQLLQTGLDTPATTTATVNQGAMEAVHDGEPSAASTITPPESDKTSFDL